MISFVLWDRQNTLRGTEQVVVDEQEQPWSPRGPGSLEG